MEEGYTVIISTHNPEHALLFAEKAFVLQDGEVRAAGPSKQVLTEELMVLYLTVIKTRLMLLKLKRREIITKFSVPTPLRIKARIKAK